MITAFSIIFAKLFNVLLKMFYLPLWLGNCLFFNSFVVHKFMEVYSVCMLVNLCLYASVYWGQTVSHFSDLESSPSCRIEYGVTYSRA